MRVLFVALVAAALLSAPSTANAEIEHTSAVRVVGAGWAATGIPGLPAQSLDQRWLGGSVGRHIVASKGYPWQWEANVFVDATRATGGGLGAFSTVGRQGSRFRHPALQWALVEDGDHTLSAGIDRLFARRVGEKVTATVGRFPVNWSVTSLLTPNDFFAPFAAAAINRIYKPGVDAAQIEHALGPMTTLTVLGALGTDDGELDGQRHHAALVRASTLINTADGGFQVSAVGGRAGAMGWVLGATAQGDVGVVNLRAEGHVGATCWPPNRGCSRVRAAMGADTRLPWRNGSVAVEGAWLSDGATAPSGYVQRALALQPDELPYLGRAYAALTTGFELLPILRVGGFALANLEDLSGVGGLSLSWSAADEADVMLGAFLPWGDGAAIGPQGLQLGSEMGAGSATLYLEARAFF